MPRKFRHYKNKSTLAKQAVDNFLNRDLDNFDWTKKLKNIELWRAIRDQGAKHPLVTKPYQHQKACYLLGINNPDFLFFLSVGCGKSKLALDIIRYRMEQDQVERSLFVVPNLVNIDNLLDEVKIHQPGIIAAAALGEREQRQRILQDERNELVIINYDGLNSIACDLKPAKGNKKKGKQLVPDYKRVQQIARQFDCIVWDEITECRKKTSLRFRIAERFSQVVPYRYGLTGTPFGRDPQDLWAQFYVVDRGATLGPTMGLFRQAFFKERSNGFATEHVITKKGEDQLHRVIKNRSIYFSEEECNDLPRKVHIPVKLHQNAELHTYYNHIIKEVKAAKGNLKELNNVYIRMRQICSGFVGLKDDEDGSRIKIAFKNNPKLDALVDLVPRLLEQQKHKIIIFTEFIYSSELVAKELEKKGIPTTLVYSKTKDKIGEIRRFKNDPDCRVLVGNSSSLDKGLNLQVARRVIFYESPVDPITRTQAEARPRRGGQRKRKGKKNTMYRVYYYDLTIANSVEEDIMKNLKQGENLVSNILKGKTAHMPKELPANAKR